MPSSKGLAIAPSKKINKEPIIKVVNKNNMRFIDYAKVGCKESSVAGSIDSQQGGRAFDTSSLGNNSKGSC